MNKRDTSNNSGNWNHLEVIQKMSKQHTGYRAPRNYKKQAHWALLTYFRKYQP